jgi:hypothetical protein
MNYSEIRNILYRRIQSVIVKTLQKEWGCKHKNCFKLHKHNFLCHNSYIKGGVRLFRFVCPTKVVTGKIIERTKNEIY